MQFEYWKTGDGTWGWELKSTLGEIVARGAPLPSRDTCLSAIKLVKLAAAAPAREVSPPPDHDEPPPFARPPAESVLR